MRRTPLVAFVLGVAACGSATDLGSPGVPVVGAWSYVGQIDEVTLSIER